MKLGILFFLLCSGFIFAGGSPEQVEILRDLFGDNVRFERAQQKLTELSREEKDKLSPVLQSRVLEHLLGSDITRKKAVAVVAFTEKNGFTFRKSLTEKLEKELADSRNKYNAVNALVGLGGEEAVRIFENVLYYRWQISSIDVRGGRRIRNRRRRLNQSKESMAKVRAKAAEGLSKIRSESSVPILLKVLRDESNTVVREYILKALLEFRDRSILSAFEQTALTDESAKNRILGVAGMSHYPSKVEGSLIKKLFTDKNVMVRLAVIRFLALTGRKDLFPFIIASAHDSEIVVKRRIADLLGSYNTKTSSDMLLLLSKNSDRGLVISSISALGKLSGFQPSSYMKLCRSEKGLINLIVLKSVFNGWRTAVADDFDTARKLLKGENSKLYAFSREKVRKRKEISENRAEREKIKLILTDVKNQCKL